MLGVAADQRQRRLRRLALAVQVIGVHAVEVAERRRQPGRIGGDQRQRIAELRNVVHCGTMLQLDTDVKKVERFTTQCLAGLRRAELLRPQIIAGAARTIDETLVPYYELLTAASATNALAGLMSEVHPDESIRDAARDC